jgi:hypothetical protein
MDSLERDKRRKLDMKFRIWNKRSPVGRFTDSSCKRNDAWGKRGKYTGFGGKARRKKTAMD